MTVGLSKQIKALKVDLRRNTISVKRAKAVNMVIAIFTDAVGSIYYVLKSTFGNKAHCYITTEGEAPKSDYVPIEKLVTFQRMKGFQITLLWRFV